MKWNHGMVLLLKIKALFSSIIPFLRPGVSVDSLLNPTHLLHNAALVEEAWPQISAIGGAIHAPFASNPWRSSVAATAYLQCLYDGLKSFLLLCLFTSLLVEVALLALGTFVVVL